MVYTARLAVGSLSGDSLAVVRRVDGTDRRERRAAFGATGQKTRRTVVVTGRKTSRTVYGCGDGSEDPSYGVGLTGWKPIPLG
ncbi:hypothetical protein Enr13x_31760 [Stieleria neptunia]|uniref:Uncharacterized protein n=1 Tax=Stieleria neptunia TaxID=2527979 RepID=A0A518HR99_9BACT|nr:hypothetical protein Enr13x_31760 [Stieleria neptunia]